MSLSLLLGVKPQPWPQRQGLPSNSRAEVESECELVGEVGGVQLGGRESIVTIAMFIVTWKRSDMGNLIRLIN